jgi:hypothetical protein
LEAKRAREVAMRQRMDDEFPALGGKPESKAPVAAIDYKAHLVANLSQRDKDAIDAHATTMAAYEVNRKADKQRRWVERQAEKQAKQEAYAQRYIARMEQKYEYDPEWFCRVEGTSDDNAISEKLRRQFYDRESERDYEAAKEQWEMEQAQQRLDEEYERRKTERQKNMTQEEKDYDDFQSEEEYMGNLSNVLTTCE